MSDYSKIISNLHPSQMDALTEELIIVDENDNKISSISKVDGHLKSKNNKFPHRAFSVFLFNNQNELLLQQRANCKFTFAGYWSNTCCSHPINIESEINTENNLGIRKAAVRRMKFELGIDSHIDDYFLMEKILYRADSDEIFEEFEVDYILLAKKEFSLDKVKASINKDEVSDVQFLSKDDLKLKIELGNMSITPWFKLIMKNKINEIFEKGNEEEKVYSGKENKIIRYI
jgi:isopentenyl-diphosphate delta-isomerase